jgi:RNA polymerase sigma-70 factor (ECF subfamily)
LDDSLHGGRGDSADASSISSSLLERVKARRPEAWERLAELYGPLVYRWCRLAGVRSDEAPDVVQEVFAALAVGIGNFRRDRPGDNFRAWLAGIARHKIADHFRRRQGRPEARGGTDAQQQLLEVPELADPGSRSDSAGRDGLLPRRALELIRAEFENRTWEAFWRTAIDGQRPAHVAEELGMSVMAVYKAKSRVLRRLRQELGDLLPP